MSLSTKTAADRLVERTAEATQLRIDKKILLTALAEIQAIAGPDNSQSFQFYAPRIRMIIQTAVLAVRK